jgi:hypothetical protein
LKAPQTRGLSSFRGLVPSSPASPRGPQPSPRLDDGPGDTTFLDDLCGNKVATEATEPSRNDPGLGVLDSRQ